MKFIYYMQDFVMAVVWFFLLIYVWAFLGMFIFDFFERKGLIIYHSGFMELEYFEKGEKLAGFVLLVTILIPSCLTYFVQFLFCLKYTDRKFRAFIENLGIWHYIILSITILTTIFHVGHQISTSLTLLPFWIFSIISGVIYHIFKPKLIRSMETVRNTQK